VLTELGRVVGRSVADVCTVLNPSRIIVGGSVGSQTPFVADGVRDQINRHCPPAVSQAVTITTAALGQRAEVLGALRLARTEL
jgi:predicted NBD/HSP70 family sugar kinase